jgi:CheY-like chemotaxis protein
VAGDVAQLHQVLLNLCVNARDAMPGGGTLSIEAELAQIDDSHRLIFPEAKPGRYVLLRISDTGTGIPPDVAEHIFEPFFSTKGSNRATGLGLSTVLGIVKSHGGFIHVESTPGQGATFAVYLPEHRIPAKPESRAPAKPEAVYRGSGETILVVDGEADVLQATGALLKEMNFQVLTAAEGAEALIKASDHRADLRAVIAASKLPHMDGLALVRVLRQMVPEVGIIITGSAMEQREERELIAMGVRARIEKPCTRDSLTTALRTIFGK